MVKLKEFNERLSVPVMQDFNRLKVFYHVFTQKSVASAARQLNITPSAVSQALGKLEAELKVSLFTRLHKELVPTIAAERLYEVVDSFVARLEACNRRIDQARTEPSGMIRIGAPIEFGKTFFPEIMAKFREKYPEVVFTLKLGDTSEILPGIRSGELDFGLIDAFFTRDRLEDNRSVFSMDPLIGERVIMACSQGYYDREIKEDLSYKNLSGKAFISYQESSMTLKSWFKHHFNKTVQDLNRVLFVNSHQAVINGIKHDLGMGVVAFNVVQNDVLQGKITPVYTPKKDIINRMSLVQLLDKIPSLTEKTFIQFLKTDFISSAESKGLIKIV